MASNPASPIVGDREPQPDHGVWNRAVVVRRQLEAGAEWSWVEPRAPDDSVTLLLCTGTFFDPGPEQREVTDPTWIMRPGDSIRLRAETAAAVTSVHVPVRVDGMPGSGVISIDDEPLTAAARASVSSLLSGRQRHRRADDAVERMLAALIETLAHVGTAVSPVETTPGPRSPAVPY